MIARLYIVLPFSVQIPENEPFKIFRYEENGYGISVHPPVKSDVPASAGTADKIFMNERPTIYCNVLRVYFHREEFDRLEGSEIDPSIDFMAKTVNLFLGRLRYVTRAPGARPVSLKDTPWKLRYLNNDESELKEEKGLIRGHGAIPITLKYIGITKEIWADIHDLPPDFQVPVWNELILDAYDTLPQIGPSLVLAATALEVFIAQTLDKLAKQSSIPESLWSWLNKRDYLKAPSIEEQFDDLLKMLCGYSLKEDLELWEPFKNLKTARNTFVHEGIAKIGQTPVTKEKALQLLASVVKIFDSVRERLPDELKWKKFKHDIKVRGEWRMFGKKSEEPTDT